MKRCTKCGEDKPLDAYYFEKGTPRASCKECHKKLMADRRAKPDWKRSEMSAATRQKNHERERLRRLTEGDAINAKRRASRNEQTKARELAWREANSERYAATRSWFNPNVQANAKRYYEANRPKMLEYARSARYKRRALLASAYVEDVPFDDILQRDLGICGICTLPILESTIELDHIIPLAAGGRHERTNVQLSHRTCNRRKWAKANFTLAA